MSRFLRSPWFEAKKFIALKRKRRRQGGTGRPEPGNTPARSGKRGSLGGLTLSLSMRMK